jgi:glucose dehydrogenase
VIAGESGMFTVSPGKRGAMLRAYDKATGREAGAVFMPGGQTGSPMTYMLDGKQYLVVSIGAAGIPGELIAFKLP